MTIQSISPDNKASLALIAIVKKHLLAQNAKSITPSGHCFYFDKVTGYKCAVGILIPDSYYRTSFENMTSTQFLEAHPKLKEIWLKKFKFETETVLYELLEKLQYIHDFVEIVDWENSLNDLELTYASN